MEQKKEFEDKLMNKEKLSPRNIPVFYKPINKQGPDDWRKQQETANFIKKINREKKERALKAQELAKERDEKINREFEERRLKELERRNVMEMKQR
jgi:hypothetical protein